MRAVVWEGKHNVKVDRVEDPEILNPRDAIIKVTLTAICGSDLHLYDGSVPTMRPGDVLGHEFMGEVVELGKEVKNLAKGDWVVVPFAIACGRCFFCQRDMWSLCDNSNPNAWIADAAYGHSAAGLFGYSHMYGGYPGGQAEYVRVPFADVGPLKIYEPVPDEQVLFLSDIFPTGYMAAENCSIQPGDTIAVWGCGPVGLFAIKSAFMFGAERVIAIDRVLNRLIKARECGAETIDYSEVSVVESLKEITGGRGPDACIDAVGMESHGAALMAQPLREAIIACRKGGTISIPGVYGGFIDRFPAGAAFAKGLTLRMGQTHVHKYMPLLLEKIRRGDIDPSFVISHRFPLDDAPEAYRIFREKDDECIKVVMKP
ncbi:MAG TPA: zinc-dependent alcohol dehydrogenase [Terriglobia bacterium]|jgi:threonine dehydrogenase-like Zn-dependent dehydrogenase